MEEKLTVFAEFSQTDVAIALMCLDQELTPGIWALIKAAPSKINFNKIEDKVDRMQWKALHHNAPPPIDEWLEYKKDR